MTITSYRGLEAWKQAMRVARTIYELTKQWPREEIYGLTNQIRRSAVSVPANIAEGQGRTTTREFLHHLSIAYGSLCETETHALLAQSLGYLDKDAADKLLTQTAEVGKLINGLSFSLEEKLREGRGIQRNS